MYLEYIHLGPLGISITIPLGQTNIVDLSHPNKPSILI